MQCKLFFFYGDEDWSDVTKHLKNIPKPYQVVTSSYSLNQFLQKNGINSKTLRDIFPEEGHTTYEIYKKSKEIQNSYRKLFKKIAYKGYHIFSGFENQLLDQIILHERARKILENKMNTIFVFEGFSFTYFAIMKTASTLGYDNDMRVGLIQGSKITFTDPKKSHSFLYLKNRFYALKNIYFPRYTLRQIVRNINYTRFQMTVKPFIRIFLAKLSSAKFSQKFIQKSVYRSLDKKLENTFSKYDAECAFFFTTNQEDLYLKSLYPIIDHLNRQNVKFHIFTIDLQTSSVLRKKKVSFLNLFEEVNLLSNFIRGSKEGKYLRREVERLSIKNNLSLLYVGQISEYLINEINRSIAIMLICEHIFEKMKLRSVTVATDGTMYGNSVITVARKYNIVSYFVPSTIINENPLHANWYNADRICVYGLQGLESLTNLGYPKERLILTGSPKHDHLKYLDPQRSKKLLEESHGIDSKKKLIVVGMARWHEKDEVWMSNLIKFCNKNSFEIIIKIHPMYKQMLNEESEDRIQKIKTYNKGLKYLITYDVDLYTLLSAADLVITDYSNIGAEAILLEKPLITVNFVKESFDKEQRYHEYGASIYTENYSKFEGLIDDILNHSKYLDELREGRKKITDMYNFYNDGNATQRIFDLLTNKKERPLVITR